MSAKSRARYRFERPEPPTVDEEADQADLSDVMDAFELAEINPRAGISKWVGAALGARDRAKARADSVPAESGGENMPENMSALREPTPYVRAVLGAMARKPMYGGTVEPWRVDERRRRNRAARKARRVQRLAAR